MLFIYFFIFRGGLYEIFKEIEICNHSGLITASCLVMASHYGDSDVLFGCIIKGKTTKEVAVLRNDNDVTYLFGKSDINEGGGLFLKPLW